MRYAKFFIFCLLFLTRSFTGSGHASDRFKSPELRTTDTIYVSALKLEEYRTEALRPSPLLHGFHLKQKKNKKIVAMILAFPFPFGMVGLHRIYLGCAPYVPVAYIGTLGGVFGILPFIDFCVLMLDKDIERYNNNKKIFMWVN